ncbi:Dabb family protein [Haloimpatiens sp. FM7330]|uniref:Dabb family protein n=1 Tax=Haloimpatiens sp. FM7330 TaxID=3298610 RepID=UPI00362D1D8D
MIKHVVMWQLCETEEHNKQENAKKMKELLEGLKDKIEDIKAIKVGINDENAPQSNFDVILEVQVEDFEALNRYAKNPLHLEVVDFIKAVSKQRVAVDYRK